MVWKIYYFIMKDMDAVIFIHLNSITIMFITVWYSAMSIKHISYMHEQFNKYDTRYNERYKANTINFCV